jgi:hypothetical protein
MPVNQVGTDRITSSVWQERPRQIAYRCWLAYGSVRSANAKSLQREMWADPRSALALPGKTDFVPCGDGSLGTVDLILGSMRSHLRVAQQRQG